MKLKSYFCFMKNIFTFCLLISSPLVFGQVDILDEDFQSGIPVSWTVVDNDFLTPVDTLYTDAWIAILDPENDQDTVASSTSYFTPVGDASRWLITPPLVLGAYGNSVSWKAKSHDASYPDDYVVLVSTTDNQITSFIDTIGYIQEENFEWTFRKSDLSVEGFDSQTIYIAFVNTTSDGFKLYMDSIIVEKESSASIHAIQNIELSIFPNPTSDQLVVQSPFVISSVRIIDNTGKVLIKQKGNTINVSTLTTGFYYVESLINGYAVTRQFFKQ